MRTITFKEFLTDYREYFHITEKRIVFNQAELEDIIYFFYETEDFEMNYENKTIELY